MTNEERTEITTDTAAETTTGSSDNTGSSESTSSSSSSHSHHHSSSSGHHRSHHHHSSRRSRRKRNSERKKLKKLFQSKQASGSMSMYELLVKRTIFIVVLIAVLGVMVYMFIADDVTDQNVLNAQQTASELTVYKAQVITLDEKVQNLTLQLQKQEALLNEYRKLMDEAGIEYETEEDEDEF